MKQKMSLALSFFFIVLLSFSLMVHAAGSGDIPRQRDIENESNETEMDGNDNNETNDDDNETEIDDENETAHEDENKRGRQNRTEKELNCESETERSDRIKCRLQNKIHEDGDEVDYEVRVPEACRELRNPVACIALYKSVHNRGCYKIEEGRRKDHCLKRAANITEASLQDLPRRERAEKARDYLVLLLYELQQRIETANENGTISDDKAAEIIDLIVEIKQDILDQKPKREIIPKLQRLRNLIREARSESPETPIQNNTNTTQGGNSS